MKTSSIIFGITGVILLILSLFIYKTTGNAVDSGGSINVVTWMNGKWTFKLFTFVGGVFIILSILFYIVRNNKGYKSHYEEK